MLDRGVWLEFDMIGLDITFPKEEFSSAGRSGDRRCGSGSDCAGLRRPNRFKP